MKKMSDEVMSTKRLTLNIQPPPKETACSSMKRISRSAVGSSAIESVPAMPVAYEIVFHLPVKPYCRVERFSGSRGNYYELEDGAHIKVHTVPAWCRRCGKVTDCEEVQSQEKIDNELA